MILYSDLELDTNLSVLDFVPRSLTLAMDYKSAGVDIDAGEALVDWLKATRPENPPHKSRLVSGIGGFAALFKADFKNMESPCLVSATDGVGTKLKVATHFKDYSGIGQDLVAMCVNDMICCGAEPLFFLDYYACGKLDLEDAKIFLSSVREACQESNCALIGGETAEMPGVYKPGDFDCAGFSVGVVDQAQTLGAHKVNHGDFLIGVSSSGFHSNGFSLLRKVFENDFDDYKKELLEPTRLYVSLASKIKHKVNAMAHITGGGMDNILRVLPKDCSADLSAWAVPPIYNEILKRTESTTSKLLRTFNCGVGLVLAVAADDVAEVLELCEQDSHKAFVMGRVIESKKQEWSNPFNGDKF